MAYRRYKKDDRFTSWYNNCSKLLEQNIEKSYINYLKCVFSDVEMDLITSKDKLHLSFVRPQNNYASYSLSTYCVELDMATKGSFDVSLLDEKGQKSFDLLIKLEELKEVFHSGSALDRNAMCKAIFLSEDNKTDEFLQIFKEITE